VKAWLKQALALLVVAGLAVLGWRFLDERADSAQAQRGGPMRGAVPVVVEPVGTGMVERAVVAVGTIRARESVAIVSEVSGRVRSIQFEEGQPVEAGALLVKLEDDRERAELREAVAMREDVRTQLRRARQLLETRNVPAARVDELSAALDAADARVAALEVRLGDREIRAPFTGVVGLRGVSPGALVEPQRVITTLDDLSRVKIDFAIPERFLGALRPGLAVEARSVAFPGRVFAGAISQLDTRVDPVSRAVRVQAEFANDDLSLRGGMFMSVRVLLDSYEAIVVPEEALIVEGERHYVFVVAAEHAQRRDVTIGQRLGAIVEIVDGLAEGELIVVDGVGRVRDGGEVRPRARSDLVAAQEPRSEGGAAR
jgi:membrane fusion protein (multidrug efflux system)